jgi:hypothetical protein
LIRHQKVTLVLEARSELPTSEKAATRSRVSIILSKLSTNGFTPWGRFITLSLDDSTYELISRTANIKGLSIQKALRLLLRKGIGIRDTPAEIRRQIDALREQRETLVTRAGELSERFGRLSAEYSTLRYGYHEAFVENRVLAMHLCGRGLADKYKDLVDRYIFTKLY